MYVCVGVSGSRVFYWGGEGVCVCKCVCVVKWEEPLKLRLYLVVFFACCTD